MFGGSTRVGVGGLGSRGHGLGHRALLRDGVALRSTLRCGGALSRVLGLQVLFGGRILLLRKVLVALQVLLKHRIAAFCWIPIEHRFLSRHRVE